MVFAMHIDMLETQRSYVFHVLRSNLLPAALSFIERILHIPRVLEDNHIHD